MKYCQTTLRIHVLTGLFALTTLLSGKAVQARGCETAFALAVKAPALNLTFLKTDPSVLSSPPVTLHRFDSVPHVDVLISQTGPRLKISLESNLPSDQERIFSQFREAMAEWDQVTQPRSARQQRQPRTNEDILQNIARLALRAIENTPTEMHGGRDLVLILSGSQDNDRTRRGVKVPTGAHHIQVRPDLFRPTLIEPNSQVAAVKNAIYQLRIRQKYQIGAVDAGTEIGYSLKLLQYVARSIEGTSILDRPWKVNSTSYSALPIYRKIAVHRAPSKFGFSKEERGLIPYPYEYVVRGSINPHFIAHSLLRDHNNYVDVVRDAGEEIAHLVQFSIESRVARQSQRPLTADAQSVSELEYDESLRQYEYLDPIHGDFRNIIFEVQQVLLRPPPKSRFRNP